MRSNILDVAQQHNWGPIKDDCNVGVAAPEPLDMEREH